MNINIDVIQLMNSTIKHKEVLKLYNEFLTKLLNIEEGDTELVFVDNKKPSTTLNALLDYELNKSGKEKKLKKQRKNNLKKLENLLKEVKHEPPHKLDGIDAVSDMCIPEPQKKKRGRKAGQKNRVKEQVDLEVHDDFEILLTENDLSNETKNVENEQDKKENDNLQNGNENNNTKIDILEPLN